VIEASAHKPRLMAVVRTLALRELTGDRAVVQAPQSRLVFATEHSREIAALVRTVVGHELTLFVEPMPEDGAAPPAPLPGKADAAAGPPETPATAPESDPEDNPLVQQIKQLFDARVVRVDRATNDDTDA
jgi:hypothetical protein